MVSMKEVRLSNGGLEKGPAGLKALFVGATAGIGASAVKQFALNTKSPTVYLAGRSQAKAAPLLDELKSLNPQATFTFIEAEVSLLKGVDKVCDEILAKEQKLDLLWVSQGLLSFSGQQSEFPSEYLLLKAVTNSGLPHRDSRRNSPTSCCSILLTDAVHL
jgi:NAD(P)-dependent dehydrogenase (short-subunit alcohol dehydrogenase family)